MTEDNDDPDFEWIDGDGAADSEEAAAALPDGDPPPAPTSPAHGDRAEVEPRGSRSSAGGRAHGRPPPSRRRIRIRRAIALASLVLIAFVAWFAIELFQPFAGAGAGNVTLVIARGASTGQIGDELVAHQVVSSSFFFKLRAELDGDGSKFHSGLYELRRGMSYSAALAALTKPAALVQVKITIPEGFTRRQIAARASADGLSGDYMVASRPSKAFEPQHYGASGSVHTLEGFLFPATYFNYRNGSVTRLVAQQLQAFQENFDQLNFGHASAYGLSRYDVLIIASMIEREAQVPSDRALVSAVIYNRLKAGIPLGIDATLRYVLNDYDLPLTQSQLALDSPYNTRLHRGLPPTPISNPGVASMIAATDPAHVSYLYYVDKPNTCGKLAFATTNAQFQTDVNAYNAARTADGGRAPTKCP